MKLIRLLGLAFAFTLVVWPLSLCAKVARVEITSRADVLFSNTSYEYWGRVCALIHVTPDGLRDAEIYPNVRIYHFTGLQHFSGSFPPAKGTDGLEGQQLESSLPIRYFWRAMIVNMDAWVRSNTAPPDSSYPIIADGTLIPFEKYNPPRNSRLAQAA